MPALELAQQCFEFDWIVFTVLESSIKRMEVVEASLLQQPDGTNQTRNGACCVRPSRVAKEEDLITHFEIISKEHVCFCNVFVETEA